MKKTYQNNEHRAHSYILSWFPLISFPNQQYFLSICYMQWVQNNGSKWSYCDLCPHREVQTLPLSVQLASNSASVVPSLGIQMFQAFAFMFFGKLINPMIAYLHEVPTIPQPNLSVVFYYSCEVSFLAFRKRWHCVSMKISL